MAATTVNQLIAAKEPGHRVGYRAAAERFYQGTLAYIAAATGLLTVDDASGANRFAGVVIHETDNSSGVAGGAICEVFTAGEFELVGSGFTQASVGTLVYGIDNFTVQASATNASMIGRVTEFISATKVMANIRPVTDQPTGGGT